MAAAPPDQFNFARHLLAANESRPHAVAFIDDHGSITHGELAEKVRQFGSGLLSVGLKAGERILLVMPDQIAWPVAFLGAMYAGLVPIPVNTLLPIEDYAYLLSHSGAAAAISDETLLEKLRQAKASLESSSLRWLIATGRASEDTVPFETVLGSGDRNYAGANTEQAEVAFWLYSSGSTGRSKGVLHTHANLYWTAELYAKPVMGIRAEDRVFSAAKLFFAYGLGNALTFPMAVGASAVLMAGRPTPEAVLQRFAERQPTIFCGAPTLYASLLDRHTLGDSHRLRLCTSAGEALPQEVGLRFKQQYGVDILDGLGSTEMLHIFVSNRAADICYGTTGLPVEGYQVQIRDESGIALDSCEQIGDLWVQGPSASRQYWNDDVKTQATFRGSWVRTGDKYYRRPDGRFVYAGRNDDMLKISGQYVSPFEVESALLQHPGVLESAVIAVADALGIQKSKAFVVLKPGFIASQDAAEELKAFVKARLAPFKRPHFVEFVTDLPKTATGKIQRFRLREQSSGTHIP